MAALILVQKLHTCSKLVHKLPRETPSIATSGELTIGVKYVPPIPPRLDIVKHPPCNSSNPIFLLRAFSAS